jgi:hypothetical protein
MASNRHTCFKLRLRMSDCSRLDRRRRRLRSGAVTATEVRLGTVSGRAIRNGRSPSVYNTGHKRLKGMAHWGISRLTARPALAVALRYGLAVASVATALRTTLILRHYGSPPRFVCHFTLIWIAVTFWCAGIGPGLFALFLSCSGVSLLARNHFLHREISATTKWVFLAQRSVVEKKPCFS